MNKAKRVYSLDKKSLTITLLKPRDGLFNKAFKECDNNIIYHNDIYDLSDNRTLLKKLGQKIRDERIIALEKQLENLKNKKI